MRKLSFISVLFLLFLSACNKDKFETDRIQQTDYKPEIAAPVINSDLGVYDIMAHTDSSEVQIDPNSGLVSLVYDGQMYSFKGAQLVQIPDQGADFSYTVNGPDTWNETYTLNVGNSQNKLDSLRFGSGTLEFTVSPSMNADVEIRIPGLTDDNGNTFQKQFPVSAMNPETKSYSLDGYSWDLTDGGTTNNTVRFEFTVDNPSTTGNIDFEADMKGVDPYAAFGDLGDQQILFNQDSILLRVFKNSSPGVFQLNDTRLVLDIENSFGVPIGINVDTLRAIDLNTGSVTPINYSGQNPFTIDAPTLSEFGSVAHSQWSIDSTNSDLHTVVDNTPKWIHHSISGNTNPSGTGQYNYVTDDSRVRVHSKLKMPLVGYAHSWSLVDTVDLSIGEDRFDNVEEVLVRTLIDNGFPFSVDVQLFMADQDTNVVDSVYQERTRQIPAASVDGDGRVSQSNRKMTSVVVDGERKKNLLESDHMIVMARARTTGAFDQEEVSVYDDYSMNVKLGLKVKGNFSFAGQ